MLKNEIETRHFLPLLTVTLMTASLALAPTARTQEFQGTENNKGKALTLASVTQDPKTQVITINFMPPVALLKRLSRTCDCSEVVYRNIIS